MAKAWSAWFPDVLPHVGGCPDMVAEHALKRAAQDLFEEVRAWHVALDPITDSSDEIDLIPDESSTEIVHIDMLRVNDAVIDVCDESEIVDRFGGNWSNSTGTPSAAVYFAPGSLRLVPSPTSAVTIAVTVSVRPSESATGVPDAIYRMARDAITFGALARLFGIVGSPWNDEGQAEKYSAFFQKAKDAMSIRAARRFSSGRIRSSVNWC